MNKWVEIIKMCIEQVEKDEEEAKKRAKMTLNSSYGVLSMLHNNQLYVPVKIQDINFIIEYVKTTSKLNPQSTQEVSTRLKDIIGMLKGLKCGKDLETDDESLMIMNKDVFNTILKDIDGVLWETQHIPGYPTYDKIEEVREKIRNIRLRIKE